LPSVSEIASVHEAAELLARAAGEGERVSIEREGGEVVLSTRRLDQVLEHEAGDMTAIVEAGVRLRDLNERLAGHGQMLALDPPGNPTLGACLAANLSGPRRHRYGTARDLVIGVTVVLGDGTIASSGGKVVKNVAGYDLGKLFCGSEGRLGLIARLALRLHQLPDASRTLAVRVSSPAEAAEKARLLLHAPLELSALDVVWPGWVAVLIEGAEAAVEQQFESARALVGGGEDAGSLWDEAAARQAAAQGRLLLAPGRLAEALAELEDAVVRVSAGVAYVPEPVDDQRDPAEVALAERVRAQFDPQGVLA
jgi:glycolate dehydrogenase FAD-binding subunit